MDIDNMGGSTLQAMAEAVEDSFAVVSCMSQKYKDSPNCRAGNLCTGAFVWIVKTGTLEKNVGLTSSLPGN